MNRRTFALSITLAAVFHSPASQAQTPAHVPSDAASTSTLSSTGKDATVANAQVSDSPEAVNTIRIVRLSQTTGKVEMDRNTGLGFEAAFNNLPITQGARLRTNEGSASVEFEDGSTLRLIPDTQVDFTQLGRSAAGATLSSMKVLKGTVYVSVTKVKGNTFSLTSGDGVIKPRPGAHLRLEVKDPESRLSVIHGTADFTNTAGTQDVGKMKSLIFNTATHAPADVIAGIEDAPFDTWDEQQTNYYKLYSHGNALSGSGSTYGLADLNYYGSFSNVAGCGSTWRPYFASAAWDPYASGIWAYYPGSGYSWVSPYPWGWAPFHYGSWMQCGGGWGWQPGGNWYGLGNVRDRHWGDDGHHHPHVPITVHPMPPRPRPIQGKAESLIAVNAKPLTFSQVDRATQSFHFRNDSAGLGIPRGEFVKLNKLSETAGKAGSTNVPLFVNAPNISAAASGGFAARSASPSGVPAGNRAGFFERPANQNRDAHNTYAERGNGSLSNAQQGMGANGSPAQRGAGPAGTAAGYTGGNRGGNSGYSGGGSPGGGYSGGPHPAGNPGGYSGGGGGGSHASAPAPAAAPSAPAAAAPSAHR
jgi:hypothetical protein